MNTVTCLTIAQMLLHSILGCCWHHGHSADVAVAVEPAGAENHSTRIEVSGCGHHHHGNMKNDEASDRRLDHSLHQDPCEDHEHEPCREDRCTLDIAAIDRAPELTAQFDSATLATLVPPTTGLLPTSSVGCGSHTTDSADLQLRGLRLRAVSQVWLI